VQQWLNEVLFFVSFSRSSKAFLRAALFRSSCFGQSGGDQMYATWRSASPTNVLDEKWSADWLRNPEELSVRSDLDLWFSGISLILNYYIIIIWSLIIAIYFPSNPRVSSEGSLLILSASWNDAANYSCVAENVAAKRVSSPAILKIYGKFSS